MTSRAIPSVRRYKIEWALLGFALLILGMLIGYWIYKEHADIDARERDRLQAQAQVIDENLGHQLKGMNDALVGVLNEFPLSAIKNMRPEASRHLKALTDAMPGVHAMFVLDAEGGVLAANRDNLMKGLNFSQREYFKTPQERPDPAMLYVSTPFRTVSGVFSINVSRVATGPRGEFAGIVIATLDPEYFNVVLRSVLYAPDMAASIVHADGRVFAVMPANAQSLGKDLSMPGSNFSRHQESGQTAAVMMGMIYATGEQRMRALRTVRRADLKMDKPLVITVGRSVSAIFDSWRDDAFASGWLYGLFSVAAGIGLYFSQKRRKIYYTTQAETEQALRDSAEELRLFTDNVPAMTVSYDENLRCRFVNRRFAEFFGLTVENTLGKHLREVVGEETFREVESHYARVLQGHQVTYHRTHKLQNGESCHLEIKLLPHIGGDGEVLGCFSVASDITEHKLAEERIQRVAHHDSLTGLPNRLLFNDRLDQAISLAKRNSREFALLYLDLDKFKVVNDSLGHTAGDELLKGVAAGIRRQVRESDTVARVGGDEFTVILSDIARPEEAEIVARKIIAALAAPFLLGSHKQSVEIGTSIGIAIYPTDARDADALVRAADAAMYSAKQAGSGFRFCGV